MAEELTAAGSPAPLRALLPRIVSEVRRTFLGPPEAVRVCLAALLARGHVLVEDVPGVGKTTLARALARVTGGEWKRIQFVSDLLPGDVTGSMLPGADGKLRFVPGPIFTHVLLADEINRASPRTQSALLEAMEERAVTVDGVTRSLPEPFAVLATQNPHEHHGASPLPESQVDRFLVGLHLGYPEADLERELLAGSLDRPQPEELETLIQPDGVLAMAREVERVRVAPPLRDHILALVRATRHHPEVELGASPRAALALQAVTRAFACLDCRDFATPDDVLAAAVPVLAHRLVLAGGAAGGPRARALVSELCRQVPVPV